MAPRPSRLRSPAGCAALAAVGAVAGCGSGPARPLAPAKVMSADAGQRTARLEALGSYEGINGEMNFDGYSYGALTVRVPVGWELTVHCVNGSSLLRHSCALISDRPADIGDRPLAFPGSGAPDPYTGLAPHQQAVFTVRLDRVGTYRLSCLVHGHEVDGMWDRLVVTSAGAPSVTTHGTGAVE